MSLPEVSDMVTIQLNVLEDKYAALRLKYEELINAVSGCYHTDEEKHAAALKYIQNSSRATW